MNYSYDALDNLLTVTQGSQSRSFVYDSLGRLTIATNPESGTIVTPELVTGSIARWACSGDRFRVAVEMIIADHTTHRSVLALLAAHGSYLGYLAAKRI